MAFNRQLLPHTIARDEQTLLSNFAGIGMNIAVKPSKDSNIEDTILAASIEGLENDDLRVLSILTTWIGVHSAILNVDRLTQITAYQSERVRVYWAAIALWQIKDRRFTKMSRIYDGPVLELLPVGTDFLVARHGEDDRFNNSLLRVPAKTLRDRKSDVLTPAELARISNTYKWRTVIGPSYRADMWAALENNSLLSITELAHLAYGSFATAWRVKKDWLVAHGV